MNGTISRFLSACPPCVKGGKGRLAVQAKIFHATWQVRPHPQAVYFFISIGQGLAEWYKTMVPSANPPGSASSADPLYTRGSWCTANRSTVPFNALRKLTNPCGGGKPPALRCFGLFPVQQARKIPIFQIISPFPFVQRPKKSLHNCLPFCPKTTPSPLHLFHGQESEKCKNFLTTGSNPPIMVGAMSISI